MGCHRNMGVDRMALVVTGALTGPRGVRRGSGLIPHHVHLRMSPRTIILRHTSWGQCSFIFIMNLFI